MPFHAVEEITGVKIRRADPAVMAPAATRKNLSPRQQARLAEYEAIRKKIIAQLAGPDDVFEIVLEPGEKLATIRQRVNRVAADQGVEVAVRVRGDRLYVGLMTPERRSRRGLRPKAAAPA
jgi:hypothetical protein